VADVAEILADLDAESADLDRLVAALPEPVWASPTPATGWSIAHQIAHLTWTDEAAALAVTDPDGFAAHVAAALGDPAGFVDGGAAELLADPSTMLRRWRASRTTLSRGLADTPPGHRIPWYGTAMSPASMATARLMETWAHGLDVADSLGVSREVTSRLRHIAHLGYRTFGYSFLVHGRPVPTTTVRLELTGPDGSQWTFGPDGGADRVRGPALDFCLLVTQRRHRADLSLTTEGTAADEWLDLAQAFAGPPGGGREPAAGATA
jgi:uncharacterized protein (TIGR03084 family)